MNQGMTEITEGLRKAMQAERTGHEFYKMAAAKTEDAVGRETFERLAREEGEHFQYLLRHYRAVVETGRLDPDVTLARTELKEESPIFSPDLRKRIGQSHFEMSALAIAVQLELNGINHYREQANRATTPEAKHFFEELVEWEGVHYSALLRQQELLQEEYWSDAGFRPF